MPFFGHQTAIMSPTGGVLAAVIPTPSSWVGTPPEMDVGNAPYWHYVICIYVNDTTEGRYDRRVRRGKAALWGRAVLGGLLQIC